MARKTVDVALIIPDASPVLTLARIDRLDLLARFGVPILIVDQVYFEVTKPEHDPNGKIKEALQRMHNQVRIIETATGTGYQVRRAKDPTVRSRDLGETAVSEYALHLRKSSGPSFIPLVPYEDPDMEDLPVARLKDVHMMNTTAWLFGMYDGGILPEGLELIDKINALRKTPMEPIDVEARTKKLRSTWKRKLTP